MTHTYAHHYPLINLSLSAFLSDPAVRHLAVDVRLRRLRGHPRLVHVLRHRLAHHERSHYIQVRSSGV